MHQKDKTLVRSLTKMPLHAPNRGLTVAALPSTKILKTVTAWVAMVHKDRSLPASSQVVASVCLTAARAASRSASCAAGSMAVLTRASTALTAPREICTPSTSRRRSTVCLRLMW